jgi:hypothetical protein
VGIATSKPAIVGYVCVATGGGLAQFWPVMPELGQNGQNMAETLAPSVAQNGPFETSLVQAALSPPQFPLLPPGLPPAVGPTLLPETPNTPIPEPGTALLLATALVAAIATIRGRG